MGALEAQGDLLIKMRSAYNQFTRAEKKVADFILDHTGEVPFMSITELSDASGVGETSVFRFCRTMGLGGYQEFKMQLSLSVGNTREEGLLSGGIESGDDLSAVVQKVLQTNLRALTDTAALLDQRALDQAVDLLVAAKRIVFFGVGASLLSAMKSSHKFLRIEPKVLCVNDAHAQAMLAATMSPRDVALVFSYSGSTKDTNAVARLARESGAKVIAITRFQKSPLTEFTDVTLLCGARESPLQGGSASADISETFLIDLLYTEYYRRNYAVCAENNRKTSASVLNKLY